MRFITSIFMLATAVTGVISAYFIGHGLIVRAEGHNWPFLVAAGLMATSAVLAFIYLQLSKRYPVEVDAAHGHGHGHDAHGSHGAHTHTHPDGTVHTHPHGPGHH